MVLPSVIFFSKLYLLWIKVWFFRMFCFYYLSILSRVLQERSLTLDQPVKIGRSVARARAAPNNAIFDCKVLSRNHALLWYVNGKVLNLNIMQIQRFILQSIFTFIAINKVIIHVPWINLQGSDKWVEVNWRQITKVRVKSDEISVSLAVSIKMTLY